MKFTRQATVTIFGVKVADVEIKSEFYSPGLGRERKGGLRASIVPLNPDYVTPILVEVMKETSPFVPERFNTEDGKVIEVNRDIDVQQAVQELKKRFTDRATIDICFGFAAMTNAYERQNRAASDAFKYGIKQVVEKYWEPSRAEIS